MATITYNGVPLSNAKMLSFATTNQFEADNRNRTGRKQTMTGVGIYIGPFTTTVATLKDTLTRPGRELSVQFDGGSTIVLANGADNGGTDAKNGPLPEITVTEIAGAANDKAFVVAFTFNWFECGSSSIQRFEQVTTHNINSEGALTISRRGYLRISALNTGIGLVPKNQTSQQYPYGVPIYSTQGVKNVDWYRELIAGSTPPGYQRTKQNYYVAPDQLTLAFDIEDTELHRYMPNPASDGDGSFEYERDMDGNFAGRKTFRIELIGPPGASQADLFCRALDIAITRIRFLPPHPDIIQSFKITEGSLIKQCKVGLEIVALGTLVSARYEPTGLVDNWLYFVLFSGIEGSGANTGNQMELSNYGSVYKQPFTSVSPKFKFDPCTDIALWTNYAGSNPHGYWQIAVPVDNTVPQPLTGSDKKPITKPADNKPDTQLGEDANKIVTYNATQTIVEKPNTDLIEPMGWGIQYGFQFKLPEVVIHQEVTMATRDTTMSIPWPYCGEAFVVINKTTVINDAPPDASGNRLFAIHATRDIRVSVWNSANTIAPTAAAALIGDGGSSTGSTLSRVVWSPTSIATGRHPVTGNNMIDLRENFNGTVQRQDYVGNGMIDSGDVLEG